MGGYAPASRPNVAGACRLADSPARLEHGAAFALWLGDGDSTDEERPLLERCRFHDSGPRQSGGPAHRGNHSVVGLEEARHRLRLGRARGAGPPAALPLSADRRSADRRRLADRRRAGRDPRTGADRFAQGRVRGRLVDGLRLFPRRPLVDRLGFAGRGGQIRLGAAARGGGAAGGSRRLSGRRLCAGAAPVVAGTPSHLRPRLWARAGRMGARPPVHRLSVERPRHGARRQSGARPDRFAGRPARADLSRRSPSSPPRRRYGASATAGSISRPRSSRRWRSRLSPYSARPGSWRPPAPCCRA